MNGRPEPTICSAVRLVRWCRSPRRLPESRRRYAGLLRSRGAPRFLGVSPRTPRPLHWPPAAPAPLRGSPWPSVESSTSLTFPLRVAPAWCHSSPRNLPALLRASGTSGSVRRREPSEQLVARNAMRLGGLRTHSGLRSDELRADAFAICEPTLSRHAARSLDDLRADLGQVDSLGS